MMRMAIKLDFHVVGLVVGVHVIGAHGLARIADLLLAALKIED